MTAKTLEKKTDMLLHDLRNLIEETRSTVATMVNASLTMLYWRVGKRINEEILKGDRAEYGEKIVHALSAQSQQEYGLGFTKRNLFNMIRFAQVFPEKGIVSALRTQLNGTYFRMLKAIEDPLKRDFYAEMCRLDRWSTRTLLGRMDSMLFERTALSKKPDELIRLELDALRNEDRLTPDLVFRDPYFLDFLDLKDRYMEKDFEDAILRELEQFLLELGVGFSFIARQKRIQVDNDDYYLDLLFFHRKLRRLLAIELKLGDFKPKEGWDVTNLYTIVPLGAANARILIEQSIGRGLRLPYGKRTGVMAVDRLNIVAHDKFQEIIDEANRPDSAIRLQAVVLDEEELSQKTATWVSRPRLSGKLGLKPLQVTAGTRLAGQNETPLFTKPIEQKVARMAWEEICKLENQPRALPSVTHLQNPEIQAAIAKAVEERQPTPEQMVLEGLTEKPDIDAIVAKTIEMVTQQTIDIPRILVVPGGEVKTGFKPFALDLIAMKYPAVSDELWIQHLRTSRLGVLALVHDGIEESRLEDYIVSGLMDFDDISYDDHADLLYDLAGQTVRHLQTYLSEKDTRKVLRCYQRDIARFIHSQMQSHYWEEAVDYEVKVSKGFTELKESAYSYSVAEPPADYRVSPGDKNNMARYLFGGFNRCLYPVQKFDSEAERKLAMILERDAIKWFKPARGQFQIFYRHGADYLEYQPDFVAEAADAIFMLEPKAGNQMNDTIVLAKKEAAVKWCANATDHTRGHDGKPWR